jgi:glycosyltransferase involved in cell wall biosynthesis
MQPRRIAMVVASAFPSPGGSAVAVKETAEALARLGHAVHLVVYDHGDRKIPIDPMVKVHRAPMLPLGKHLKAGPSLRKPFWDAVLTWRLLQVVREHEIEIIHAHNYEAPIAGYIVRWLTGVPVIYHPHNTMVSELHTYYDDTSWVQAIVRRLAIFLDKQVPPRADFVIAITKDILHHLIENGVAPQKIIHIPFGIDLTPFTNSQRGILSSQGLNGEAKVVYTGMLDEFQEIDKLIAAFRRVHDEIPESVLVLAGNFTSRKYHSMCEQFFAAGRVCFIERPSFKQIVDIISEADVAVVPRTVCPGVPIKLLNYMAAGKPTVTFEGSAKGVRHMENGLVVKNGDIDAFAEGIIRLLKDRSLAKRLGEQARQTVQKEYRWPAIARQISEVYDKVLERNTILTSVFAVNADTLSRE